MTAKNLRILVTLLVVTSSGCASPHQATQPVTCQGEPGDVTLEVPTPDGTRTAYLHVPENYAYQGAAQLVLVFHGLGGSAAEIRGWTQFDAEADAGGFLVAYPEGLFGSGRNSAAQAWNAGVCCGEHDDVAFVAALIDRVAETYCVDRSLVYATGLSLGGALSYRLACELSDEIAAVAPVSAGMLVRPLADCQPSRSVPVLSVQGTSDAFIPYAGGPDGLGQAVEWTAVADEMAFWRELEGCNAQPVNVYQQGDASCQRWCECHQQSEVELCTIDGGGHTWPGLAPDALPSQLGRTSQDLNAKEYILRFFARHPLR